LRTVSVLHLASTRATPPDEWDALRHHYIKKRLTDPNGQIEYNERTHSKSLRRLKEARRTFLTCSVLAFAATLLELLTHGLPHETGHSMGEAITGPLGPLAIILPVLAVAGLSLAAAFDMEARVHISREMTVFLKGQKTLLEEATTSREYARLLQETESRLLGETANWYTRRSFTGVA
jgi:hypothetical protein